MNVATLPETLATSLLFGHVKGAFTDARERQAGVFLGAHGGTLFLDEVGSLPSSIQAMLLRVLQEREVMPLGGTARIPVDVRVIAATNRNLAAAVAAGEFRDDLYYRLNGFALPLPPLRERPGDVRLLVQHHLAQLASQLRRSAAISPAALQILETYRWPGNVRQVEPVLRHALMQAAGAPIEVSHLPAEVLNSVPGLRLPDPLLPPGVTWPEAKDAYERRVFAEALEEAGGNLSRAAARCGIDRATLRERLKASKAR